MRFPTKISFYMGQQFLLWLSIGLLVFTVLTLLVDSVDILRRAANRDVPYRVILEITVLRLPNNLQQIAPFAFLFGGILCFNKLTRSRELVVTRASGVSVWQFLLPSVSLSLLIGVFIICFFNPLSAMMNNRAAMLEDRYLDPSTSLISFSKAGLWVKQKAKAGEGETLITAASISADSRNFKDVTIFQFTPDLKFARRVDAGQGQLMLGKWDFKNVVINAPNQLPRELPDVTMPTKLSLAQIQDSFNPPDTISFWALPEFIKDLEASGFSALRHKLYFHQILTTPIVLATMILIAAVFSLRFSRRNRNGILISGGVFTGFVFFFVTRVTASFGINGSMPIVLAAWTPTFIFVIIGVWILLHLEDG